MNTITVRMKPGSMKIVQVTGGWCSDEKKLDHLRLNCRDDIRNIVSSHIPNLFEAVEKYGFIDITMNEMHWLSEDDQMWPVCNGRVEIKFPETVKEKRVYKGGYRKVLRRVKRMSDGKIFSSAEAASRTYPRPIETEIESSCDHGISYAGGSMWEWADEPREKSEKSRQLKTGRDKNFNRDFALARKIYEAMRSLLLEHSEEKKFWIATLADKLPIIWAKIHAKELEQKLDMDYRHWKEMKELRESILGETSDEEFEKPKPWTMTGRGLSIHIRNHSEFYRKALGIVQAKDPKSNRMYIQIEGNSYRSDKTKFLDFLFAGSNFKNFKGRRGGSHPVIRLSDGKIFASIREAHRITRVPTNYIRMLCEGDIESLDRGMSGRNIRFMYLKDYFEKEGKNV